MPRQSVTWLITDTHFNHEAIIESCKRPPNHKELLIKNCQHYIQPQDILIHLGDTIFYNHGELKGLLDSIKCRKALVKGNHDKRSNNWYMNNGFDFVCDLFQWNEVVLTHRPLKNFPTNAVYNIHGHWHLNDHSNEEAYKWWNPKTHYKLSIEETNYNPVKLIDVINKLKSTVC